VTSVPNRIVTTTAAIKSTPTKFPRTESPSTKHPNATALPKLSTISSTIWEI